MPKGLSKARTEPQTEPQAAWRTACYWGDNGQTQGIGYNQAGTTGGTAKVEGSTTWETAMNAMNMALTNAGTGWQYVTGSGDAPLTLRKQ